jgi:hypothetical protein
MLGKFFIGFTWTNKIYEASARVGVYGIPYKLLLLTQPYTLLGGKTYIDSTIYLNAFLCRASDTLKYAKS